MPENNETAWRKAIADQVRRTCTLMPVRDGEGRVVWYHRDDTVAAVADWIENPPAWSAFDAPFAQHVLGQFPTTIADAAAADEYFAEHDVEAIAVRDAADVLYLLSCTDDGVFYVGIPMGDDPEDDSAFDHHNGMLERPLPGTYCPTFPLTVLTIGKMAMGIAPPRPRNLQLLDDLQEHGYPDGSR